MRTLADALFRAMDDENNAETELSDYLDSMNIPYEDFECDPYDRSIELYTNNVHPDSNYLAALFDAGFEIVFWHWQVAYRGSADMNARCFYK